MKTEEENIQTLVEDAKIFLNEDNITEAKLDSPTNIAAAQNKADDMKFDLLDFGDKVKKFLSEYPEVKKWPQMKSFSNSWKTAMKDWDKVIKQFDKVMDKL